jgi:predicted peptidase
MYTTSTWRIWSLVLVVLVAPPASALAASVSDFIDFSLILGSHGDLPGRLYVPPEAASDPSAPRPLIVFLHGSGEAGSNNIAQINGNINNLLAEAKRRGAFLYAPQSPGAWGDKSLTDDVMSMVDRALTEQNVDARRLYVTGLSNGGGGAWNMLSRYDNRFAAGVPIAGVFPEFDFLPTNLVGQSIWAFHARNDPTVGVGTSQYVVNSILAAAHENPPTYPDPIFGPNIDFAFSSASLDLHYTEYASGGHGIWPRVYNTPAMYDWLFSHALAVPEPSALTLAGIAMVGLVAARRTFTCGSVCRKIRV